MKSQLFPKSERGIKDIGWLRSNFYFSFSDYCHPLKSAFGTLVAFNDDYVEAGKGFGIHPHTNRNDRFSPLPASPGGGGVGAHAEGF
jgi:quercetin 2,3-dioxygenase